VIKYRLTEEMFLTFGKELKTGIDIGYQDGNRYYTTDEHVLKLKRSGYPVDAISIRHYGDILDNILADMRVKKFKIYGFVKQKVHDEYQLPSEIDFTTGLAIQLHKKLLRKIQGKPTSAEYYEKKYLKLVNGARVLDPFGSPIIVYENLICRIDFNLIYDSMGFIVQKKEELRWYYEDGALCPEYKDIGRLYDPILDFEFRIEEGKLRRSSIVNGLQLPSFSALKDVYPTKSSLELLSIGRSFLTSYQEDFMNFIESSLSVTDPSDPNFGKKIIVLKIMADPTSWLNAIIPGTPYTIRQYMISELSI